MVRTKKQDSTDNAKGNLWTVGHSNRTLEVFIDVLQAERIEILADVRSFPSSRRHPQFDRKEVEEGLSRVRISYHWLGKQLGGYRSGARVNNPHIALQRPGLRAYADYMESGDFQSGIKQLLDISREGRTVYMCAEKLWWECHRSLISDYLVGIRGAGVVHILERNRTTPHSLSPLARASGPRLVYDRGQTPALF